MEKVKPAFLENAIPICFSANDHYAPLLATTISSIAKNSNRDLNYDIVVLFTNISDENKIKLMSIVSTFQNISLRFVNVGAYVFGYNFYIQSDPTNTKYSDEIYYRVLVPSLFENYSKIIFLDADVVVKSDLKELFEIDLGDNLVGAVRDFEGIANCYNNNYERTKYRLNNIGIKKFENYFTSGVMVMNISEFLNNFDTKSLLDLAVSKDWKQYDQDLFNYICKDRVKILDAKWNFVEDIFGIYNSMPKNLFEEYLESEKNPQIIHFSGNRKPWIKIDSKFNDDFWEYAKSTQFYDELKSIKK